jgi:hypothetical protein
LKITRVRRLSICLFAGLVAAAAAPASAKDFVTKLTDQAIKFGIDEAFRVFKAGPVDFLYDIHLNAEDRTPLPIDKDWQVGTNLAPNTLPFAELNLSGKTKLHREHAGWPQVDVNLGGWYSVAGPVLNSVVKDFKGQLYGIHGGILAAASADPRLRVFAGYEFSQMRTDMDITWKPATDPVVAAWELVFQTVHGGVTEHFLFAGAEVLRTSRKRLVAEIGYGVVHNKLVARLTWASKNFDTGFAFYPEGAWVVWPVWNFQVRF